jgi:hypothetical protein
MVRPGNILWRAINGVPDTAWSVQSGQGRTILSDGGLSFVYTPGSDPESVVVSVTAYAAAGTRSSTLPISEEVMLRNKGL